MLNFLFMHTLIINLTLKASEKPGGGGGTHL